MTSTWIVGVDGSDNARHAAEWAIDQAVGRDVRIVVLATWTLPIVPMGAMSSMAVLPDWSDLESELRRSTEALATKLSRDGVEVEARIAQGSAADVLIEASREADLLVVGARGLGRVTGLVLGSVSQRCVSHSVAPVAVIAMEAPLGPARRILVGYDASANARTAAQWALGFAQPDAAITILDALGIAPWLAPDLVRERFPVEVEATEAEFRTHMGELDPDNRADHSFVIADARVALLDASTRADLVVLGARGRGRLAAMLLGSTTTWMLQSATRATVVVPLPERASD
ncbi:MAG: universal stress protein [Actinomycetota bacterium]|nr:MAG: universal stress protein [Actinomycetota bacterium]